ncbi:MAG: hypothetical protein AB7H70_01055 [Rhodospirillaceae bacterium]
MSERVERGPLKLPRTRRWTVYGVSFVTWITGVLWLIYHYFMATEGRFGPETHPLEPWWKVMHAGASFFAVGLLGLLWGVHILRGWNANWRRWSGGTLAGFFFVLTVSGYALYYIYMINEDWKAYTSIIHWALGLASIVVFFIHWLSKSKAKGG